MLKNMELDEHEGEEESIEAQEMEKPKYPYGLTLTLDEEALEKLGIALEDHEIHDEMVLHAVVKVMSKSGYETQSDEHKTLGLQICEMELTPESELGKAAKKIYGKTED